MLVALAPYSRSSAAALSTVRSRLSLVRGLTHSTTFDDGAAHFQVGYLPVT